MCYDDVLKELLASAKMDEFGRLAERGRVRDLYNLSCSTAGRAEHRIRLTVFEIDGSGKLPGMWAAKPVLARWAERRGLPVPPWLVPPVVSRDEPARGKPPQPPAPSGARANREASAEQAQRERNRGGRPALGQEAVTDWYRNLSRRRVDQRRGQDRDRTAGRANWRRLGRYLPPGPRLA
jgi:hypothetical protein